MYATKEVKFELVRVEFRRIDEIDETVLNTQTMTMKEADKLNSKMERDEEQVRWEPILDQTQEDALVYLHWATSTSDHKKLEGADLMGLDTWPIKTWTFHLPNGRDWVGAAVSYNPTMPSPMRWDFEVFYSDEDLTGDHPVNSISDFWIFS